GRRTGTCASYRKPARFRCPATACRQSTRGTLHYPGGGKEGPAASRRCGNGDAEAAHRAPKRAWVRKVGYLLQAIPLSSLSHSSRLSQTTTYRIGRALRRDEFSARCRNSSDSDTLSDTPSALKWFQVLSLSVRNAHSERERRTL